MDLNYPQMPLRMEMLEEVLLKFSNDIRLQDDIMIIEARYSGYSRTLPLAKKTASLKKIILCVLGELCGEFF